MMHPDPRLQNIAPESALRDPVSAVPVPHVTDRVCTAMDAAVTEVFNDCLDALFYTACAAPEAAHRRCIEAVRELRARQVAISAAFRADIRRLLEAPAPGAVVVPFASLHSSVLEGELADTLQMILKRADEHDAETRDSGNPTLPAQALTARRSVESFVRCCGELHIEHEHLQLLLGAFEHVVVARLPTLRAGLSGPGSKTSSRHAGNGAALQLPPGSLGREARIRAPRNDSIPEAVEDKVPEIEEVSRLIARFKAGGLKLPHATVADQLGDIAGDDDDDDDTTAAPPSSEQRPTQPAQPGASPKRLAAAAVVCALLVAAALKLMFSDPVQLPSEQYDVAALDALVSAATNDAASEPAAASSTEPLPAPAQPVATAPPVVAQDAAATVAADAPPLVADSAEVAPAETPPPVVVDARLAQQARYVVQRAEVALRERRLTTPFEDSAWANYLAVLAIDPDNAQAHTGLQHIVTQYRLMIRSALERGDRDLATVFLERAQAVAPDAPELESLRLEIVTTH